MTNYVIGVDLGGTQLRGILIDRAGNVQQRARYDTAARQGPDAVIAQIADCVNQLRQHVPTDGVLLGVGIGAPGPLDPRQGIVFMTPNMSGWENVPLRDKVAEQTGMQVAIGNDANVAALGEWLFGAGQGYEHVVYITISTGIGGGVILHNQLLLGRYGAATELGHMLIENRTSWEKLASGTALAAAAARAMPDHPASLLHTLATPDSITSVHVSQAAAQNDALARQLMQREAELIGLGLVNVLHVFSPDMVLVGGGVVTANPWLLDEARAMIERYTIAKVYREVPIQVAQLGSEVGVLGAAALAFYALESDTHDTTA